MGRDPGGVRGADEGRGGGGGARRLHRQGWQDPAIERDPGRRRTAAKRDRQRGETRTQGSACMTKPYRKSVGEGKSVPGRVNRGGRRIKTKKQQSFTNHRRHQKTP